MNPPPNTGSPSNLRALVLTAIQVEFKAVRAHLRDLHEEHHEQGNIYERGTFETEGGNWEVLIVQTGATNQQAALETERAIQHFKPNVALFIGVAGGLKDVAIGDVVAATKVYGYESGKASTSFEARPEVGRSGYALANRAAAEARSERWRSRITVPPSGSPPRVFVAPIAAGEKVVANTRSTIHQFLRNQYGDALAVEMEGLGFLNAVHANQNVEALVVRGISDCIDSKSAADEAGSQEQASRHASAFAFEVLSKISLRASASSASYPVVSLVTTDSQVKSSRSRAFRVVALVVFALLVAGVLWGRRVSNSRHSGGYGSRDFPPPGGRGDWQHRAPPPSNAPRWGR